MATENLKSWAVALVEAWNEEREYSGVTAGDKHKLFTRIAEFAEATAKERDAETTTSQSESSSQP